MTINTRYFGALELDSSEIIRFSNGIFGFEGHSSFVVIRFGDEGDDGLFCLQSVEDEDLAFVLINPFWIDPNYNPIPSGEDIEELGVTKETPVTFFAIAVLKENFIDSTVNLRCPILINYQTRTARQIVLESGDYSMKTPVPRVKGAK